MRIIHFVENLERGGLERVVIELIRAQLESGDECRVICLFQPGLLAAELESMGVRVDACHKRNGMDLGAVWRARAWLREWPGAVLHTHNAAAHYHAILAGWGLALAARVNTRHGMGAPDPESRKERFYRRAVRATDTVVAVCEAARSHFARQGVSPRRSLTTILNGIRTEASAPASPAARARLVASLGLPEGTRLVGTVGRLNPVKDQASLIRAFGRLHRDRPDTALVLVGDGPARAGLEALARELDVDHRVRFMGDRDDVAALLPGLDVFALPSLSEGYSMALLEACAAALPAVVTRVGGNGEIVAEGVNGHLVPVGDPERLAAALQGLLDAPERATEMGRAGREQVLRENAFRTMAERYARVYRGQVP